MERLKDYSTNTMQLYKRKVDDERVGGRRKGLENEGILRSSRRSPTIRKSS